MTGRFPAWLAPLGVLYGVGVAVRTAFYDAGWLRVVDVGLPVISVGNLTVGGTGKTPATIWLAERLSARGERPAILTRGYGRRSRLPVLLAPGRPARGVDSAGDEPLEMSAALPAVPILVCGDRALGARLVRRECHPTLLLMDDGFQHRRLHRCVNIALLDAGAPFGNGRILPAGPLREPPGALRRADLVLLTRAGAAADPAASLAAVRSRVRADAWVGLADHRCGGLVALDEGGPGEPPPPGTAVVVAVGIAGPAAFQGSLAAEGWACANLVAFPDHHVFTAADRARVEALAGGRPVVTTRKDAARWRAALPGADWGNWWVARLDFAPRDPGGLMEALLARLASCRPGHEEAPGSGRPGRGLDSDDAGS